MDKIEKIRKEVERLLDDATTNIDEAIREDDELAKQIYFGRRKVLIEIKDFIDSLQDEPKDHSLPHVPWEKGYQPSGITCGTVCKEDDRLWIELNKDALPDYNDCAPIDFIPVKNDESKVVEFDHFEEDLEKELDSFIGSGKAIKEVNCGTYKTTYIDPLKIARHFVNWQKRQLMKEYVDIGRASVVEGAEGNEIFFDDFKKVVGDSFKVGDRLEIKAIKHTDKWTQQN
jgi:hypothetical protein